MSADLVEPGSEFPVLESVEVSTTEFLSVIERGEGGWGAYVPDLPGVVAAAETEEEVRSLIAHAIEFHLEGLREENDPVPVPVSRAFWVVGG